MAVGSGDRWGKVVVVGAGFGGQKGKSGVTAIYRQHAAVLRFPAGQEFAETEIVLQLPTRIVSDCTS